MKPIRSPKPQPGPREADLIQKIKDIKTRLGIDIEHVPASGGANDQELYPTDQGLVDFRLAGRRSSRDRIA